MVKKLKYSVKVDVYPSETTKQRFYVDCFMHFVLTKTEANNTDFRTGKPVNTAPDWTDHMTRFTNHCTRILVRNPYCLLARQ